MLKLHPTLVRSCCTTPRPHNNLQQATTQATGISFQFSSHVKTKCKQTTAKTRTTEKASPSKPCVDVKPNPIE